MAILESSTPVSFTPDREKIPVELQLSPEALTARGMYPLISDSYTGGGGFLSGSYLLQHKRELSLDYMNRQQAAYYPNFMKPVVDTPCNIIQTLPVERQTEHDGFRGFLEECTLDGQELEEFMRRVALTARLFGVTFIGMDKPAGTAFTKREEYDQRLLPYVYHIMPSAIRNYGKDRAGISWIAYDAIDESGNKTVTVSGRNDTKTYLLSQTGEYIMSGAVTHGLGVVPVIPVYYCRPVGSELLTVSDTFQIARLCRRLYNLYSELDESLRKQAFNILVLPDIGKEVTLGTNNALAVPPGKDITIPFYLAPDPSPMEIQLQMIDRLVKEIYRLGNLEGVTGVQEAKSGVARAYDFESMNQAAVMFAEELEQTEKQISRLWGLWMNEEVMYACEYPDNYNLADITTELENTLNFLTLNIGGEANRQAKAKLINSYFNKLSQERRKGIIEDMMESAETTMRDEPDTPIITTN